MPDVSDPPASTSDNLKQHSVGTAVIVFFVVSAAAPLAALVATAPYVFGAGGLAAPLAYVAIGVLLLLFSVGYAAMARHVVSAAGMAAFVERALGKRVGIATACVAVFAYSTIVMGLFGGFGYFTSYAVQDRTGLHVSWWILSLGAIALCAVLGYRAIDVSAKVLGVLVVCEVAVLLLFDIVSTARGGAHGISIASLNPHNLASGGSIGIAFLFAALAFIGFEATSIYGEEAKNPKKSIPIATYCAVTVIASFYALTMWALSNAYGVHAVLVQAGKNPAGFVMDVIPKYLGSASGYAVTVLVVTSYFAGLLALHNTLSRYVLSLGRAHVLPAFVGRTHPRWKSPHRASLVSSVGCLVVVGAFALAKADPFVQLFGWLNGLGTVAIFVVQAFTSIAVVVFFRKPGNTVNVWVALIAPILSFIGLLTVVVLAIKNWGLLSNATSGPALYLPWLIPVVWIGGLVVATVKKDTVIPFSIAAAEPSGTASAGGELQPVPGRLPTS